MKKAFTLAEIMVVLTVIGVLSAILLPVAYNAAPDEDVMKFKKANSTLASAVRELVNSDKYYLDGELCYKADGTLIDGNHDGDYTYFCRTLSDILSTKSINCSQASTVREGHIAADMDKNGLLAYETSSEVTELDTAFDYYCKQYASQVGAEIVTADDTILYQLSPAHPFGYDSTSDSGVAIKYKALWSYTDSNDMSSGSLASGSAGNNYCNYSVAYNKYTVNSVSSEDCSASGKFYYTYKVFCIDIDGIDKGEDPFGYGIRVDGKIWLGARAKEWSEKSIQRGED